jgi:uncharacterized protein YggE
MINDNLLKVKNITIAVFLLFLIAVIAYSLFFGPAKKYGDSLMPMRTINVSAQGKITVSPDIAKFSFSVVSEGSDPKAIADANNTKMNEAVNFVKSQGIDEKDIKTTEYNLSPQYEYDEETRKTFISGYRLTQTALVKIRDLDKVAEVLSGLPGLGINQIGSISFGIDEPEKYLSEARNQAFDKAKTKAEEMAAKNGVKIIRVINFYEYQINQDYSQTKVVSGLGGAESIAVPPQIQPGSQEVTVQINVNYEIE